MIRPILPWWPSAPSDPSVSYIGNEGETIGAADDSEASDYNSVINGSSLTDSTDDDSYDSFRDIENYIDDIVSAIENQYQFNADEARKSREWSEMMSNTAFQRAVADMKAAGINPLLAINQLGGASTPSAAQASSGSNAASSLSSLYSSLTSQRGQSLNTAVSLFRLVFQVLLNFLA